MKLHAYKGEKVADVTLDSLKDEVRSAAREFFQPIAIVAGAVVSGGARVVGALQGHAIRRERLKKSDSAPR